MVKKKDEAKKVSESEVAPPKGEKKQRLADKAGSGMEAYEGDVVKLREIEGEEVIVVDFNFGTSKFGNQDGSLKPMIVFQLQVDGDLCKAFSSSKVLVEKFQRIDEQRKEDPSILPDEVIFFKDKSEESGRSYWNIK